MGLTSKRDKEIMEQRQQFKKAVYEIAFGKYYPKHKPYFTDEDVIKELRKMKEQFKK